MANPLPIIGPYAGPLVLALGLAAPVLNAGWAADMVKLGLGNAYLAAATADDETRGPKLREDSFSRGTEIQFKGRTSLDRGVEVGFHTEISRQDAASQATQRLVAPGHGGDHVQAMYVYVKSGLGTIALGEPQSTGNAYGNLVPLGGVSRDDDDRVSLPIIRPLELRSATGSDMDASLRKVSYFTPRFGGVQFGVSFNPASAKSGAITLDLPGNVFQATGSSKSLEFNANYKTEFKGFQVELGGSYLNGHPGLSSQTSRMVQWGAAGAFGYSLPRGGGDLSLAGAYSDNNCNDFICSTGTSVSWLDSGNSKAWNVGLRYSLGSWNLGGYFLSGQRTDTLSAGLPGQNTMVFLQTSIDF